MNIVMTLIITYNMFRLLIISLFGFSMLSCEIDDPDGVKYNRNHAMNDSLSNSNTGPLTYLALGDSYTIGESVAENQRWPVQLIGKLKTGGVDADPAEIIARTGWTTGELLGALQNQPPDTNYDLVSLLIGVNNQYRGYDISNFEEQLNQLLDSAIVYAGGIMERVFVVSIPDYSVTPFAANRDTASIREGIDTYNTLKKEVVEGRGIKFYYITDISREARTNAGLLANDGLHPSGEMYRLWIERIYPGILEILSQ
jgi:lysophospholipase L1-like esterase